MKSIVVGITGGVAAGKSTLCKILKKKGCKVINSDKVNHELLKQKDIINKVSEIFGKRVLDNDQNLNIKVLGETAFTSRESLKKLTSILYPEIKAEIRHQIQALKESNVACILLEAPTLFEADCSDLADFIITVEADLEKKEKRANNERNWILGEIAKREAFLLGEKKRSRLADKVIYNNGNTEQLEELAEDLWRKITEILI